MLKSYYYVFFIKLGTCLEPVDLSCFCAIQCLRDVSI
nr:CotY/CotZ family spore coat protein [Bacillus sp. AR2-1]